MAPKKAKKGKKQASDFPDPEDVEDSGVGDIPEPTAAAAKPKTSAPKKKKGKKALKAGDWSDEEPAEDEGAAIHEPEEVDEAAAAPQPPAAASTFALLEVRDCLSRCFLQELSHVSLYIGKRVNIARSMGRAAQRKRKGWRKRAKALPLLLMTARPISTMTV